MRGNGGIIGPKNLPTVDSSNGVWALREVPNYKNQDIWPGLAPPALFPFTSFTFTTGNNTGRYGPTLATLKTAYDTSQYSWLNNTTYFNAVGGIQYWKVPATGNYTIRAVGATGSNVNETNISVGNPADITATISLTGGDTLKILCGQPGSLGDPRPGWGGGGGSFVVLSDNTPLVVAGGTGAPHTGVQPSASISASLTTSGQVGQSGTPATGGAGAGGNGGGGGGLTGDGFSSQSSSYPGVFGLSFINGGRGGDRGGGFGGGGGCTNTWGGGGGGYSGGAAGNSSPYSGGGGGSFITSLASASSAVLYGNSNTTMVAGFVTITKA